jgi:thiamine-phosphate pyrophosphorylase
VQEALRVLEEFGRNLDPELASTAAEIRYGLYDLEVRILEACGRQHRQERLEAAKLCLITDPDRDNNLERLLSGVEAALKAGVSLVQYRRKRGHDQQRLQEAQALKALCRRFDALLIINDRIDLALLVDADGVHLGQDDLPLSEARQLLGPERLLGRSTHRLEHLLTAQEEGADYLGVGPVFATQTKRDRSPAGLSWVTEASRHATVPWFAIGGIDAETIRSVRAAGAERVAVVSAIMESNDPEAASRTLLQTLT